MGGHQSKVNCSNFDIAGKQKRGRIERPRGGETVGKHSQDQRARLQGPRTPLCIAAGQVCLLE